MTACFTSSLLEVLDRCVVDTSINIPTLSHNVQSPYRQRAASKDRSKGDVLVKTTVSPPAVKAKPDPPPSRSRKSIDKNLTLPIKREEQHSIVKGNFRTSTVEGLGADALVVPQSIHFRSASPSSIKRPSATTPTPRKSSGDSAAEGGTDRKFFGSIIRTPVISMTLQQPTSPASSNPVTPSSNAATATSPLGSPTTPASAPPLVKPKPGAKTPPAVLPRRGSSIHNARPPPPPPPITVSPTIEELPAPIDIAPEFRERKESRIVTPPPPPDDDVEVEEEEPIVIKPRASTPPPKPSVFTPSDPKDLYYDDDGDDGWGANRRGVALNPAELDNSKSKVSGKAEPVIKLAPVPDQVVMRKKMVLQNDDHVAESNDTPKIQLLSRSSIQSIDIDGENADRDEGAPVSWYLSDATKEEIRGLKADQVGSFLVHDSKTQAGNYCISVWTGDYIYTGLIEHNDNGFAFEGEERTFFSLRKLVMHYTEDNPPGCECPLYIDPVKEAAARAAYDEEMDAGTEESPIDDGEYDDHAHGDGGDDDHDVAVDDTEHGQLSVNRKVSNELTETDIALMALPTHDKHRKNISPEVSSLELRKAGWLMKSSKGKSKHKRWFVLQDTMLKVC